MLTTVMTQGWQRVVLWGVMVGFGTGCLALVFAATVANRWFVARRGLVTGVFSAAYATGQLIFLPLLSHVVMHQGWRQASIVVGAFSAAMVPVTYALLRDRPSDVGLRPYGATEAPAASAASPSRFSLKGPSTKTRPLRAGSRTGSASCGARGRGASGAGGEIGAGSADSGRRGATFG